MMPPQKHYLGLATAAVHLSYRTGTRGAQASAVDRVQLSFFSLCGFRAFQLKDRNRLGQMSHAWRLATRISFGSAPQASPPNQRRTPPERASSTGSSKVVEERIGVAVPTEAGIRGVLCALTCCVSSAS